MLTPSFFPFLFSVSLLPRFLQEGGLPVLLRSDCADPSRWSVASFPFTMTVDPGMYARDGAPAPVTLTARYLDGDKVRKTY